MRIFTNLTRWILMVQVMLGNLLHGLAFDKGYFLIIRFLLIVSTILLIVYGLSFIVDFNIKLK